MNSKSLFDNETSVMEFYGDLYISSTINEDDVLLEPCVEGENACVRHPQRVEYGYLFMSTCIIANLGVWVPFTIFEANVLKAINIAPSQLHQNS